MTSCLSIIGHVVQRPRSWCILVVTCQGTVLGAKLLSTVALFCVCLADQQDAMQKKTFTKWVNSFLVKVTATYSLAHCMASLWQ